MKEEKEEVTKVSLEGSDGVRLVGLNSERWEPEGGPLVRLVTVRMEAVGSEHQELSLGRSSLDLHDRCSRLESARACPCLPVRRLEEVRRRRVSYIISQVSQCGLTRHLGKLLASDLSGRSWCFEGMGVVESIFLQGKVYL